MKFQPLLDHWQKPPDAGDPMGVIATTFTLDGEFFERSCLARYLAVESVAEGTGSVEDLVASLEMEESLRRHGLLRPQRAGQALDAAVGRSALPRSGTGLLHSKVAILMWERATRVIIGSANLTPAGYRHQLELAMAVDLGTTCLLPVPVLEALADEIETYVDLVPGLTEGTPARGRAVARLATFRERVARQSRVATTVKVAFAPSNRETGPLDTFEQVWSGNRPLGAVHLSPFWDSRDPALLRRVADLLTGHPAKERWHDVAVVLSLCVRLG